MLSHFSIYHIQAVSQQGMCFIQNPGSEYKTRYLTIRGFDIQDVALFGLFDELI